MNGILFEKVHQIKLIVKDFRKKTHLKVIITLSMVKYLGTWHLYYKKFAKNFWLLKKEQKAFHYKNWADYLNCIPKKR